MASDPFSLSGTEVSQFSNQRYDRKRGSIAAERPANVSNARFPSPLLRLSNFRVVSPGDIDSRNYRYAGQFSGCDTSHPFQKIYESSPMADRVACGRNGDRRQIRLTLIERVLQPLETSGRLAQTEIHPGDWQTG